MKLRPLFGGFMAAMLHLALRPPVRWPASGPTGGLRALVHQATAALDVAGIPLALLLLGVLLRPRLRDPDLRSAALLWIAVGSALSLGAGTPAGLGAAALAAALLLAAVLAAPGRARIGLLVALATGALSLSPPAATPAMAPLFLLAFALALRRRAGALSALLLVPASLAGVAFLWREIHGGFAGPWQPTLRAGLRAPLPMALLRSAARDPILLLALLGVPWLRRIGVRPPVAWALLLSGLLALATAAWVGPLLGSGAALACLAPALALPLGAFLDRSITFRTGWLGAVLGSVLGGFLLAGGSLLPFQPARPWWIPATSPHFWAWVAYALPVLFAGLLIGRALLRVPGAAARAAQLALSGALAAGVVLAVRWYAMGVHLPFGPFP